MSLSHRRGLVLLLTLAAVLAVHYYQYALLIPGDVDGLAVPAGDDFDPDGGPDDEALPAGAGRLWLNGRQFLPEMPVAPDLWADDRAGPADPRWLGVLAVVPLGVALLAWQVRRLARRPGIDAVTLGFRYWRFQSLLLLGTWVAWMAAVAVSGAVPLVEGWVAAPGTAGRVARWGLLYVLPPFALILLAQAVIEPAPRRLRELDWPLTDLTRRSVGLHLYSFVAVLLVCLGVAACAEEGFGRTAVLLLLAALVAFVGRAHLARHTLQLTAAPLTHGELRDRVTALAQHFGVAVPQVAVLTTDHTRLVNAFALPGRGVWLTDSLLRDFSRREVDAVLAHELAHLRQFRTRKARPNWVVYTLIVVAVLILQVLTMNGVSVLGRLPASFRWEPLALAVLLVVVQLTTTAGSRRREFDADRGSAEATGDPPALIIALRRLARLNGLPETWGRWEGLFLTHPPTARRTAALARLGRLSTEQAAALGNDAAAESERYSVPAEAAAGRVYSAAFRQRVQGRVTWLVFAAIIVPPVLAAWLAELAGPGRVANGLLLAGALAAPALYLLLLDVLALSGNGELRRGVRAKLQAEGIDPEATGGVFVAFAPAAEPLLYEGSGPWDVGFLLPAGDRLAYVGEQARFVLTREHVRKLRLAPGVPSWLRTRRVALTWHDPATGAGGTVAVWPCDSGTVLRQRRATVELARRLSAWRDNGGAGGLPPALADLGPPALGTVHAATPRSTVQPAGLVTFYLFLGLVVAGLCVLLGVPLAPTVTRGGGYVLAVVAGALTLQWLPYWLTPVATPAAAAMRPPACPPVLASAETRAV